VYVTRLLSFLTRVVLFLTRVCHAFVVVFDACSLCHAFVVVFDACISRVCCCCLTHLSSLCDACLLHAFVVAV